MTDAEVIMHEALEILEGAGEHGHTAAEIYEESRLATGLGEVTGALNRLRNQKQVCRSTDKRWRTMNHAQRNDALRAERVEAAAKAVAEARAKPAQERPAKKQVPKQPATNSGRAERLCPDTGTPCSKLQCSVGCIIVRSHEQTPPRRDISPAEALDAVSRVASGGRDQHQPGHEQTTSLDWLIAALEEESDAAQVRLDRYVNALGDEILEHLVEMALAANRALEAARNRS